MNDSNNNGYMKWRTFTFISGIFILVIGAMFSLLWNAISKVSDDITYIKVDAAITRIQIENITEKINKLKVKEQQGFLMELFDTN